MHRRELITLLGGTAAAWPRAARAQQAAMPVIGVLHGQSLAGYAGPLANIRKGLSEMGYVENRNVAFEYRAADAHFDRYPALAVELVRRRVAVILTLADPNAALAAKAATATIPIVFTAGNDPVGRGLVVSLSRPGGNATGVSYLGGELAPKRLELLRELVPPATTIGYLVNPTSSVTEQNIADMQAVARSVRQQIIVLSASTVEEIDAAFTTMAHQQAGALLINGDVFFSEQFRQIAALGARYRLPTSGFSRRFPEAGGLMSYGDDRADSERQAGLYVGRILKGEKPADLPVLQPTKFDFVINLKTVKTLGIELPPSFHLRATEVIE
jgi:putative ABC transport system substrate-binding protein